MNTRGQSPSQPHARARSWRSRYEHRRQNHAERSRQPAGKLAYAELHFTDGELEGLKLIGFAAWERRSGSGRNVTFPARQWVVDGEGREFALLRPIANVNAQQRVQSLVLNAYGEHERREAVPSIS